MQIKIDTISNESETGRESRCLGASRLAVSVILRCHEVQVFL